MRNSFSGVWGNRTINPPYEIEFLRLDTLLLILSLIKTTQRNIDTYLKKDFHRFVRGETRGIAASCLRSTLRLAEVPYSAAMRVRNLLYDTGVFRSHQIVVPVISVGNMTLGGTGKTPFVAWVADFFQQEGRRAGILSRGYGAVSHRMNDEAMELAWRLPDVPHVQHPRRKIGAEIMLREHPDTDILVLDDALQHRQVARNVDIVLLDATDPFGCRHVFPRGLLREPLAGLRRAHVVVLSRAEYMAPLQRESLRVEVQRYSPDSLWVAVQHSPDSVVSASSEDGTFTARPLTMLDEYKDVPCLGVCAIGNPAAFGRTLGTLGISPIKMVTFPDHHSYGDTDLDAIAAAVKFSGAGVIFCTMKDLVKIRRDTIGGCPICAISTSVRFLHGEDELRQLLVSRCGSDKLS